MTIAYAVFCSPDLVLTREVHHDGDVQAILEKFSARMALLAIYEALDEEHAVAIFAAYTRNGNITKPELQALYDRVLGPADSPCPHCNHPDPEESN